MSVANIERLLLFRVEDGHLFTQGELTDRYGFEPDGSNLYYGLNQTNLTHFRNTGEGLNPSHQAFFADLLDALSASAQLEKSVVLGLEPLDPTTFDFVSAHMDLLRAAARDMAALQARARGGGKRLRIIIRYASEMNDPPFNPATNSGNPWGQQPAQFRASFREVRTAFREEAPEIRFTFSPAIRADVQESRITDYWPGAEFVDIISCTWYIRGMAQAAAAVSNMRAFFRHRLETGKAFGFDELSGRDLSNLDCDRFIREMLEAAAALEEEGVRFEYSTLFLQEPWGRDATLDFLTE
jgi:hypothetical protein